MRATEKRIGRKIQRERQLGRAECTAVEAIDGYIKMDIK
jgi:hypothetical protein